MVLLLVFMQLTRDLFAIAKFLLSVLQLKLLLSLRTVLPFCYLFLLNTFHMGPQDVHRSWFEPRRLLSPRFRNKTVSN